MRINNNSFKSLTIAILLFFLSTTISANIASGLQVSGPDSDAKLNDLKSSIQEEKLFSSTGGSNQRFGQNIIISGDRAVIRSGNSKVTVFDYNGINWNESADLIYPGTSSSISLDGDRILVGVERGIVNNKITGYVYVFDYDGENWNRTDKLTASNGQRYDNFGHSVALSGDFALIGATGFQSGTGTVYAYWFNGYYWDEIDISISGNPFESWGESISISGNRAIVGATRWNNSAGGARVYERNGLKWINIGDLRASDGSSGDYFGYSSSLSGNWALIGAHGDDSNVPNSGAAYLFEYNGSSWIEKKKLTIPNADEDDQFGRSLSISGSHAIIGAGYHGDSASIGAAYLYVYDGSDWTFKEKIIASDGAAGDRFGAGVNISNHIAMIGSPGDDHNTGSVYVYNVAPNYNIRISVNGLSGGTLSLANGADTLNIVSDGTHLISILNDGINYDININAQPTSPNQICSFTSADSGIVNGSDVTITIECITEQYAITGNISGLANGNQVTLISNLSEELVLTTNGAFSFTESFEDGSNYSISVLNQPTAPNQICSIVHGSGTISGNDIDSVLVECLTEKYSIGGMVTGLASGNSVTLTLNSGSEYLVVNTNNQFVFFNELDDESSYSISVFNNPTTPNQTCSISNGSGSLSGSNVTNIEVSCIVNQYFIGGMVIGLIPDNYIVLKNNGNNDLIITSEGPFVFTTPLNDENDYSVSIDISPKNPIQPCEIFNESGTLNGDDIDNIFIFCDFGDDLIFRYGFDESEAISQEWWELLDWPH